MPIYKIYMRSFAPWNQFGELTKTRGIPVPVVEYRLPSVFDMGVSMRLADLPFGGPFHGDGRGFSLDTGSPGVTARVNALLEVVLPDGVAGKSRVWCDESRGPWMGVGFEETAFGTPGSKLTVSKDGQAVKAVISYWAANPLVKGAPDIDAAAEYSLTLENDKLTIVATVTGDQFPACESFIEDEKKNKVFLGGFAPANKEQILRLYGKMNKPSEVWFESEIVVAVDSNGYFQGVTGGGSGSNTTGPACEGLKMSVTEWNARIMSSIPMPSDAP